MIGLKSVRKCLILSACFLVTFGLVRVESSCSVVATSEQTCNFMASFVGEGNDAGIEDIYSMVRYIYDSIKGGTILDNEKETRPEKRACKGADDGELLEMMKDRQEKRKEEFDNLQSRYTRTQLRFQDISRRNTKHLAAVQALQNKYQSCRKLRIQLLANVTKISGYASNLERVYNTVQADVDKMEADMSANKIKCQTCEEQFAEAKAILSQVLGPSPQSDYLVGAGGDGGGENREGLSVLKQRVLDFTASLDRKQSIIDELRIETQKLREENANLQAQASQQLQESNLTHSNCMDEMLAWKEKYYREKEGFDYSEDGLWTSKSNDTENCVNRVITDFCSLESIDLAHNDTCWFERVDTPDFNWRVVSGRDKPARSRDILLTDHTCSSHNGRFLFVDLSTLMIGQQAHLTSTPFWSDVKQCFSFWYNIGYSFNYGKFYAVVLMKDRNNFWRANHLQVWRQNLVTQEQWQFSSFEIPAHVAVEEYRIQMVAESNGPGYVALDDLSLTTGPCSH